MESEELVFLLLSHTKTEGCHMNSCPDALHMLEMYSSLFFDETESEEQDFLLLNHRGTEANPPRIPIQPRLILPAHVGQERPNHEMPHAMNQNLRVNRHLRIQPYA
ncbi:hypothetical protein J6590_059704 [Homalodisca vitripennis]|nr:hypothetical protein J6590_059704 [Homalodisca vitripennis]